MPHPITTTASTLDPIRLFDGPAPGSETWTHDEMSYFASFFETDVITNVVVPTLTPVLPASGNGAAVIVAPGGGYHALSINREGFEVAQWLAERGVAAFVLKYRLVPSGDDAVAELIEKMTKGRAEAEMAEIAKLALLDAEAAVRLVRDRAESFAIDPTRVGFIGFSAGGNLTLRVAFTDDAAARPDFVAPIYAAAHDLDVSTPPQGSGPMFLAAATNDQLGLASHSLDIYRHWHAAGMPVELHLYAEGGHGFGMGTQGLPSDTWIERFGDWLAASGLTMAG
ncbi:MAG: alpha/beta hydrolase [Acidimicrobiales bacterium]